jgi:superfamily II DNA/RNA helicase
MVIKVNCSFESCVPEFCSKKRIKINPLSFLDQEERERAVSAFREGRKDVLVATDVASKGLDFPNIAHVINYDMPDDIENYGKMRT